MTPEQRPQRFSLKQQQQQQRHGAVVQKRASNKTKKKAARRMALTTTIQNDPRVFGQHPNKQWRQMLLLEDSEAVVYSPKTPQRKSRSNICMEVTLEELRYCRDFAEADMQREFLREPLLLLGKDEQQPGEPRDRCCMTTTLAAFLSLADLESHYYGTTTMAFEEEDWDLCSDSAESDWDVVSLE